MNKNAYEIRLDILRMAHDDLFNKYHETLGSLRYNAEKNNELFDSGITETLYPKTNDIIARAQELYSFVS
jgi:hypothetical protein